MLNSSELATLGTLSGTAADSNAYGVFRDRKSRAHFVATAVVRTLCPGAALSGARRYGFVPGGGDLVRLVGAAGASRAGARVDA
jgi:hypothetical protein